VQVVGALLLFSLLVTPSAIAQRLIRRPFRALALSAALALLFTWIGIAVAFYTPYPVSFVISALAFGAYLLVMIAQRTAASALRRGRATAGEVSTHTA
jgi:zinc/manganese transport system permease protein